MKLFISWSGERSRAVAQLLYDWIPNVIQSVKPWMSEQIAKGARWSPEIARELQETRCGLICLTPENLTEPWILFEAGALSKTLESTFVCPYLFDLRPSDLRGPLAQFQATKADREDTQKLIETINAAVDQESLPEKKLRTAFEMWWSKLESELKNISPTVPPAKKKRPIEELLEEVLTSVRGLERGFQASQEAFTRIGRSPWQWRPFSHRLSEPSSSPAAARLQALVRALETGASDIAAQIDKSDTENSQKDKK